MIFGSTSVAWPGVAVRNERGIALLIVLVVVALLTITVMEFTYNVQLDQHRTRNAVHALQAQLLARSGVNLAEGFLMLDEDATYDAYTEDWWLHLREFCNGLQLPDESMHLRCLVRDESGKLNINNTRGVIRRVQQQTVTGDAVLRDALRCMFEPRGIEVDIVDKLADYWQQEPQVKSDGTPQVIPDFTSLEDFGANFGIAGDKIRQLRGVLTAQPRNLMPRININTAPLEVLQAVLTNEAGKGCGAVEAVSEIMNRQTDAGQPIKNVGEINFKGVDNADIKKTLFDVRSRLFRLEASAVTNADPSDPTSTGIGQTLSSLVYRQQGPLPPGQQQQTGANGQPIPNWTLRPLDWQKEGGARLFRTVPGDENLPGSPDDQNEPNDAARQGW